MTTARELRSAPSRSVIASGRMPRMSFRPGVMAPGATEAGIRFDDTDVGIEWPTEFELLYSQRDRDAPRLAEVADSLPFTV